MRDCLMNGKRGYYVTTEKMAVGYNGVPVVDNIELHIARGEILTLIGPNGAGKSTILKSMMRQLPLIGGAVYLDGQDMRTISSRQLAEKLSVVMTNRIRTELLTCEDVVAMGRYPYTGGLGHLGARDMERVREAMELVHASELARQDFMTVSDGQRQRIMLAKAICQEPELMILDEPTSFLDIRHKLELLAILKRLAREKNMAVIMSLHELELAQKISDSVACVKGTRLDRYGTPEEIFISDYIEELYEMPNGSYNALFGCLEPGAPEGLAEVFVIGGGGSGIPVYRQLQKSGIPFATGVLHENDVDYQVAKALAQEIISETAFEPVSETHFEEALACMMRCGRVICRGTGFGSMNGRNRELLEYARTHGLLEA